jgi:transcriptional regulator with XRE-family HTH domain
MLGWTQIDLANRANVSLPSIKRLEKGNGVLAIRLDTLRKLQTALEKGGVEFIDSNGGGPGVRLKK